MWSPESLRINANECHESSPEDYSEPPYDPSTQLGLSKVFSFREVALPESHRQRRSCDVSERTVEDEVIEHDCGGDRHLRHTCSHHVHQC